jgi:hypothetical protein
VHERVRPGQLTKILEQYRHNAATAAAASQRNGEQI